MNDRAERQRKLESMKERALAKAGGDLDKAVEFFNAELRLEGDASLLLELMGDEFGIVLEQLISEALGDEWEKALAEGGAKLVKAKKPKH